MPYPSFHPGRSRPSLQSWQRLLIVGTVLAMVFSTHLTLPAGVEAAAHVATADVALRSGPGPEFEALLTIPAGSTVEVTGEPENGYLPVIFDDVAGYAAAEYLAAGDAVPEPSSAESGPIGTRYVTGGDLNLRSGPGTTSSVLLVMPDGAAVELTGQVANEFAEVTWNGTTGWAVAQFLGTDPPATESAPATDPTVAPETASTPASGNDATEETTSFSPQALQIGDTPVGTATVVTGGLSLNMRSGPGTTFGVIRSIPNGATVDVMGASEAGFLPVRYQGSEGWSSANYLRTGATAPTPTATATPVTPTPGTGQIGDTPVGTATVITDGLSLNMRSGPGTTYGVIRSIPSGATVDVMGAAQNGFLPVRYSGTKGWASATWLRAGSVATPTSTPVTPTATPATPTSTPATPTSTPGGIGDTPVGSATVITDGLSLNLRSGPGTTFGVIRSIPSGATVDVMGAAQNGFLPVRYAGTKGWASAAWLRVGATTPTPTATASPTPTATPVTPTSTPVTPTATPTGTPGGIGDTPVGVATVNTGGLSLYMRSGPGSTFSPIRTIPNGATVDVMGAAQNGYLPVRYQGTKGWSSATYLRVGSGTPTPTATATTTPTVTPTATPVTPTPTTTPVDPNNPPIGDMAIGKATINATVSLRRGPGTSYTHVQTLNSGWKVEIMGSEVNGWTPIRYNAAKGWVPSSNLTAGWGWPIVDQMITPSRSIPMYSTPGGPTLVVQVPPGTLVDITGTAQGTWVPARWAGYSGWMDASRMYQPEDFVDPGPANAQEAEMIALIYQAADKWGQSRADMLRVARCESALDPNVVNPRSGTSGLFQFMPSTFAFTPNGKRGENIFDPWSNADAAGWMWANGMRHHWACQ